MTSNSYLIFQIDELFFAIPVNATEQILRAAELTHIPQGPELLLGLLNIKGDILPVVNLRKQLHRPERALKVSDRILVVKVGKHRVAFSADHVQTVAGLLCEPVDTAEDIYPELEQYFTAASRYNEQNVLIYDIEKLIPPHQVDVLHQFLQQVE